MNYKHILIVLLAFTVVSCQKKEDDEAATSVNINISAPQDGQVFNSGDTVQISAVANATGELHGYETKITDTATGAVVFDDAQHTHTDNFTVNSKWAGTVTQATVLKITVMATIDHNGNVARKEVFFKMVP